MVINRIRINAELDIEECNLKYIVVLGDGMADEAIKRARWKDSIRICQYRTY